MMGKSAQYFQPLLQVVWHGLEEDISGAMYGYAWCPKWVHITWRLLRHWGATHMLAQISPARRLRKNG